MLNPSRADATLDDPTIRRCMGLAQGWDFGTITVVNLFAYCTAHPQHLKQVADPVGSENDITVLETAAASTAILLAWGNWGSLYQRDITVLELLSPFHDKCYCLGHNRTGQPRHPLYVRQEAQLMPWWLENQFVTGPSYSQSSSRSSIASSSSTESGRS
jgi:hypothetical protein